MIYTYTLYVLRLNCWINPQCETYYAPPPFEEGGAYCYAHVGRYVGRSVSLNLVQLITQERFAPEASNLVGR